MARAARSTSSATLSQRFERIALPARRGANWGLGAGPLSPDLHQFSNWFGRLRVLAHVTHYGKVSDLRSQKLSQSLRVDATDRHGGELRLCNDPRRSIHPEYRISDALGRSRVHGANPDVIRSLLQSCRCLRFVVGRQPEELRDLARPKATCFGERQVCLA